MSDNTTTLCACSACGASAVASAGLCPKCLNERYGGKRVTWDAGRMRGKVRLVNSFGMAFIVVRRNGRDSVEQVHVSALEISK